MSENPQTQPSETSSAESELIPTDQAAPDQAQADTPVAEQSTAPAADGTAQPESDADETAQHAPEAGESVDDTASEPAVSEPEAPEAEPATAAEEAPAPAEEAPAPAEAAAAPLPKPSSIRPQPHPPAASGQPDETHHAVLSSQPTDPTQWGHVAEDGTVVLHAPDGERAVGSYPGASPEEALAYFGRKFDELVAQVDLAEQRLGNPDTPVKDVLRALGTVKHALPEANVVGDIAGLVTRITELEGQATSRRAELDAARQAARAESAARRTALVEEAEKIAAIPENKVQWRQSTDRMKTLLDEWKTAQSAGPRLDKASEDELWKRFSHARNSFDRMRRQHFAKLHTEHEGVKQAKEKLIERAEALSTSTDWGGTAAAYRDLMTEWKKAGRAGRKDDDALWARFRAAQDVFFNARNVKNAEIDAEFGDNLQQKEALLKEAEALLPIKDLGATKSKLRSIHDRWDKIGKVPRNAMSSVERRMRAVEQAVRDADNDRWKRSNPETKARAEGALGQLDRAIEGLEKDLEQAQAKGDRRRIKEAEDALAARRAWRDQIAKLG